VLVSPLPVEAEQAVSTIRQADIVIGIPSFNNSRTIGHVVKACHAGLAKYFPNFRGVVVNSDGGSTDGTREAVLSANVDGQALMLLSTPKYPLHRFSLPYHGIPGKGSAFRMVFEMARRVGARACAVVDSDLRSITPEWIDLLVRPVLFAKYDLVAPYYHRHKYDGTITNSIVYPLSRCLYGARIRQPIGGDFGLSAPLLRRYLERDVWETDIARFGIDIWMTTVAVAEDFGVCQSFLGAKLHDAKDPAADLSTMLQQVVGSVFTLMQEYEWVWRRPVPSRPVPLFGFRFDVGLDPIAVDTHRMLREFRRGISELEGIWNLALKTGTVKKLQSLSRDSENNVPFRLNDTLWAKTIFEFSSAYRNNPLLRPQLLRSLTPLYLGRVASFVKEVEELSADAVEERMERLCLAFEEQKPYLLSLWSDTTEAEHV
jgi:glycosyltransferase involved in cell wall biosynthesis